MQAMMIALEGKTLNWF